MPEISRFFGIVIRMYFTEHAPPHFHAVYGESQAEVGIDPIRVIVGRLPPRVLSMVAEWAGLHRRELMDNWSALRSGQHPQKVPPLEQEDDMFPRITEARHVRGYVLELAFAGGERAELDFRDMIVGRGGVIAELEDVDAFSRVRVDHEAGTIAWPNGVDFCPVVLYSRATGKPIPEPDVAPSRA